MASEERLTKLTSDIQKIRDHGRPKIFPEAIKAETVALVNIFGSAHVTNISKLSHSVLHVWRKIYVPNSENPKVPILNITRCVVPKQESNLQKPLLAFIKNGITCEMYNESIAIKIAGDFLK